jgi:hypothetical protein
MKDNQKYNSPNEVDSFLESLQKTLQNFSTQGRKYDFKMPTGVVLSKSPETAKARKEYEDIAKTGNIPTESLEKPKVENTVRNIVENIFADKMRGI